MAKGSAADLQATVVSGSQLGKLLGISERRVRELRDDGVIPDNGKGQYALGDAVKSYCAHIRPAAGKSADGGSEDGQRLDEVRVRLLTLQADHREMLNGQMRGEVVTAEDMEAVVGAVLDGVRSKVLAIPSKAAPQLLGLKTLAEMRDALTGFTHAACDDIAATDVVCTSVTDRARGRAGRGLGGDAADEAPPAAAAPDRKRMGR